MRGALILCLALLQPLCAAAQGVRVIGDSDCATWSQDPAAVKASWLLGYLSGMNMVWSGEGKKPTNPLARLITPAQAYQWMDGYCKLNPGKKISEGAQTLFFQLAAEK